MTDRLKIEFYQWDWIPGFAAFFPWEEAEGRPSQGQAFCVLNLGSILWAVEAGKMPREEVPYMVAESMMHEIIHVLEDWAKVEFNEERVEALLEKYRQHIACGS